MLSCRLACYVYRCVWALSVSDKLACHNMFVKGFLTRIDEERIARYQKLEFGVFSLWIELISINIHINIINRVAGLSMHGHVVPLIITPRDSCSA